MIAAAYRYVDEDAEAPTEVTLLNYGERFGWQQVFGRTPGAGEMRRIVTVENVINAYRAREQAADMAQWAKDNPGMANLLNTAIQLVNDGG